MKTCLACGKEFEETSAVSGFCPECVHKMDVAGISPSGRDVPAEPLIIGFNSPRLQTSHCPVCHVLLPRPYNYCFNCGQRLDWSKESETEENV